MAKSSTCILPHWLDPLSPDITERLVMLIHDLHLNKLPAETVVKHFDDALKAGENELGCDHLVLDKIALKCALDLKGQGPLDAPVSFLKNRWKRAGEHHFGTILNLTLLHNICKRHHTSLEYSKQLLNQANRMSDPIMQLLALTLIAKNHDQSGNMDESEHVYGNIDPLLKRANSALLSSKENDQSVYYYVLAYRTISFLEMVRGNHSERVYYLLEAMKIVDNHRSLLDLSIVIQTQLLKALKRLRQPKNLNGTCDMLLTKLKLVLLKSPPQQYELKYATPVREAFMEISQSMQVELNCTLFQIGELIYKRLLSIFGDSHHEVVFIASMLALNSFHAKNTEASEKYQKLVETGLDLQASEVSISSKYAKARTAKNITKFYLLKGMVDNAEQFCRYQIKLYQKLGGNSLAYSAALEALAFILCEQGKEVEAVSCLEDCLAVLLEHFPHFYDRHKEIEEYIFTIKTTD